MESLPLKGRVAWVIGASGAIGSVIAGTLAAEGALVVVSGRAEDKLARLAAAIAGNGGRVHVRRLDLCERGDIDAAAEEIARDFERIDALVNSAALSIFGDFLELSDEQWLAVIEAKLFGYVRSMRAVLPYMVRQGGGAIINISGRGGRQPTPAHLPGGCANAAVNLLTKGIADSYLAHGVRANVVAPGPIVSERFEKIRASNERIAGGRPPRAASERMGLPEDVANAVLWLLSGGARHITGAVLPVDGGGTATV